MSERNFSKIIVTVLVVMFLLFCANFILGLGFSLIGMVFTLAFKVIGLLFSKEALVLGGICAVIYLVTRKPKARYRDNYPY